MRTPALVVFITACSTSNGAPPSAGPSYSPPFAEDAAAPDASPAASAATCNAPLPSAIPIASVDRDGYPPYAADGCTLVYVAPGSPGELRARDLASLTETTIAPASESPHRPTIAGGVIAWEATEGGRAVVRVRVKDATTTITGDFDHADEPRAAADAVVFTAWRGADALSDTDVMLYDVALARADVVIGGAAQQRFADVSQRYVAASDFSEDPDGVFNDNDTDLADIVIFDRATRALTPRPRTGKQAFPLLVSASRFGYLDWGEVHPEPKFAQYTLFVGDITGLATGDTSVALVQNTYGQYVLPAGRGGYVEWVDRPNGTATFWRAPVDASQPPTAVSGLDGLDLYAPASAESFTLLGTVPLSGGSLTLRAIGR
jgi:hypothetical protein